MGATLQALQVLGALTSIGLRALEASFKLQSLLRQARAENRDISEDELAALRNHCDPQRLILG